MRRLVAAFLVAHGLIHLMGFAKAFGLARLPELKQPIPPPYGVLWLLAALLFLATAASVFVWPRWWWAVGAIAIVASMAAIGPSWSDARFGALANLVALVAIVFGFLAQGPFSLRAEYDRDVERGLARVVPATSIADADLAPLPPPVQRYLRACGVVGQPRVRSVRATMHGRIRSGPDARWMPFTSEQYNFFDQPSRLFYMDASMFLIPIQGYHRYIDAAASMRVKAGALVAVADASGSEMTTAETVTMFNDMCILAPATLVDPAIAWQTIDPHTVRATFANAGRTIRAELAFNEAGDLANFWSDDRRRLSADRRTMTQVRWSTPASSYRVYGSVRLFASGEARWDEPTGQYTYIQLEIDDVRYNVPR